MCIEGYVIHAALLSKGSLFRRSGDPPAPRREEEFRTVTDVAPIKTWIMAMTEVL